MGNDTRSDAWVDYDVTVREDAHQLLAWSYSDVRARIATASDEYEITGLLADGIEARLVAAQTPERYFRYAVYNEKPTSPRGQLGKARPKLDIQIVRCGGRSRPEFTFEAKRMRDDSKADAALTMRQYLGPEGLGRFRTRSYVPTAREVAMLGCMQAHDAEFWYRRVAHEFEVDTQRSESLHAVLETLRPALVVPDLPNEWLSVHETIDGGRIGVYHLFLDCS